MKLYKKINLSFLLILTVGLLLFFIIHPRVNNGCILFISIIFCITQYKTKKEKAWGALWFNTILFLIGLIFVWYFTMFFNIFCPYHTVFEYKHDIQTYKMESNREYYTHFPDTIPKGATKVKWKCTPNGFQGAGYEELSFHADQDYLNNVYDTYKDKADFYFYKDYAWENDQKSEDIPTMSLIPMEERKDTVLLIIKERNSKDKTYRTYCSGIYMNKKTGFISYFSM